MTVPAYFVAGDTVKFSQKSTAEYSSTTGWAASFVLKHESGNDALTVAGVADGSGGWDFTITAVQSAALTVSPHWWQLTVSKSGERYTLGTGSLTVGGNIAGSGNHYDGRLQAEKDLEAVQAEIRARVQGGASLNYTIGSRSLAKEPISALMALESKLRADVARAKAALKLAQGLGSPRSVFIRFGG